VRPLERLEKLARTVRETKDYSLRTDIGSQDEIGRLGIAFNAMLAELARAREREAADQSRTVAVQSELAHVSRLTTMGEMAATVAHEINQPLAAIVAKRAGITSWDGPPGSTWSDHAPAANPDFSRPHPGALDSGFRLRRPRSDGHLGPRRLNF
jgi:signal transduction histidine kinase